MDVQDPCHECIHLVFVFYFLSRPGEGLGGRVYTFFLVEKESQTLLGVRYRSALGMPWLPASVCLLILILLEWLIRRYAAEILSELVYGSYSQFLD